MITTYAVLISADITKSFAESSSKFTQQITLSHSHYDLIGIMKSSFQTDTELNSINAFLFGHTLYSYDCGLYFSGAVSNDKWLYTTHFEKLFSKNWKFNTSYQFETDNIGFRIQGKILNLSFNVGYQTYNNQIQVSGSYPITDNILWYASSKNYLDNDIFHAHTGLTIHFVTGGRRHKERKGKSVRFLDD